MPDDAIAEPKQPTQIDIKKFRMRKVKPIKTLAQWLDLEGQERSNTPMRATTDYGVDKAEIVEAIDFYKRFMIKELEEETEHDKQQLMIYYSHLPLDQVRVRTGLTDRKLGLLRRKYFLKGMNKRVGLQHYANA